MDSLFTLCVALSISVIFAMLGRAAGSRFRRKQTPSKKQIEEYQKIWRMGSRLLTYLTCLFLAVGFLWCVYFLILGIVSPGRADYAESMSQLIVSVLTIVSIAFAFYEFIRRK